MYADGEPYHSPDDNGRITLGTSSQTGSWDRPITPGGDAISDELGFASKWKLSKKSKKGGKGPSRLRESVNSDLDSPATAFAAAVNQTTGFSPLNPTMPLQEDFNVLSPPPSKTVLAVQTPPQPRREFLRDPSQPPTRRQSPSPTEKPPVPELPPPTPPIPDTPVPPPRPSFESVRPTLFRKAFFDSIGGAKFDDTQIYLCSARSKAGVAHRPKAVHARSDFLHAASVIFTEDIYGRCIIDVSSVHGKRSDRVEYSYDCDSDLEECEEEPAEKKTFRRASPATSTRPATLSKTTTSNDATPKSAASATLSATDIDVVSLDDFNSAASLSLSEETEETAVGSIERAAPAKPILSLETNDSILKWRDEHPKGTAIPLVDLRLPVQIEDASASKTQSSVEETIVLERKNLPQERTLFIPESAYRTWQALLLFLYNDFLEFAPLRSQGGRRTSFTNGVSCSPKSMYRLATKLGLEKLRELSFGALEMALSKENVVEELFSDFTWRYPDVLRMETEVFHRYASEPSVQSALQEKFQDIAYGQMPHSSVVLSSLFQRFIPPSAIARK
ncbi:uncharacterized protein PHACADRAFT_185353 [Phanerochaete carnosa HHB-10118-sp]|uniref:BTB domain-containing protein n=1 Tax=Phanerochaete carnosa (strain HHB-10118-sp) TaxID=650164 RepID=K5WVG8_PHACS|nr:uncharacterized protein PHACADRAFT_185353 [Phanerochaete carnosa HHB-10118-sp]EKM54427.1 hypothetical protein PHACADRAFT_185353 [Phanerochaete carnosa HHB-10118-sp]